MWISMKKKISIGAVCLLLCFGYRTLNHAIPDHVSVRQGEEFQLENQLPVTFEKVNEKEKEEVTLVSLILNGKETEGTERAKNSYIISCKLVGIFPMKEIHVEEVETRKLLPGGIPVGIYVKTDGIMVIGTSPVNSAAGGSTEPSKYLLRSGDYIQTIDGEEVDTKEELMQRINDSKGNRMCFGIRRDGELIEVAVEPVLTAENTYKAGIWVRDDLAGVGTMTYAAANGTYGALGHGVSDVDTSTLIQMDMGLLYRTNIVGIVKGEKGSPGELSGVINYSNIYCMGDVTENKVTGVYGRVNELPEELRQVSETEIGYKQEVQLGEASIVSTIEGERKEYKIEITGVDYHSKERNKGIKFEVVDEELIRLTGGIVQGMSGSPIIQNGKIIGGVTHVFVNDPTKGYGIFIEEMLGGLTEVSGESHAVLKIKRGFLK